MSHTNAQAFFNDPKVIEAKKSLLEALARHQSRIVEPKPPAETLKTPYAELLKGFGELRGGSLFYPYLSSGIGNGALVELADGSVKYDFISGIGAHHFGHSHPKLIEASLEAALGDTVMQGNLQQNVDSYHFAKQVKEAACAKGAKLSHVFLTSTGVMGGENAIKIALQKKHPASRMLAFENCFMGRTLALSQFTDKAAYREGLPINFPIDYVPFFDPARPEESRKTALTVLKKHLKRYPKQHAAMSFELIQGEGGFNAGDRDFFIALMEELKANNVAVLIDEVQTFARTTELFAFQHFGLDALVDVVWFGKASQACGTLFTSEFKPRPGLLSQTFTASSSAIAAGSAILREMLTENYFGANGKIVRLNNHFIKSLTEISTRHPDKIANPSGVGAMIAFVPFQGKADIATKFIHALFENGVIAFTAGADPVKVRFLFPAGATTENDITAVCRIIEKTLVETAASL